MMMSEFIERTGFEPTAEEYEKIEEEYYNFNGDKDAFCADWLAQGGIMRCCKARAQKIAQLNSKILEIEHQSRIEDQKQLQRIADLEAQLDKELEWQPYTDSHNFPRQDYEKLLHAGGTTVLFDEEAKVIISDEFGFAPEKIEIVRQINTYEINRHHQLRRTGTTERMPIWNSTDWQYIRFNAGNWMYEYYQGELHKFAD